MTPSDANETAAFPPRWGECAQDVLLILCAVRVEAGISATGV